jgi:hypothetical protein
MTPAAPTTIEPGVYAWSEDTYHADPVPGGSVTATGLRKLTHGTPAAYRYWRDHQEPPKRVFDLGSAAHRYVLGKGATIVEVDAVDYKTKNARAARDAAYEAGKTPLLPHEHEQVKAMAAALQADPLASRVLDLNYGTTECSIVWRDPSGITCRARLDYLRDALIGGWWLYLVDYKTTTSASVEDLEKSIFNFGYHQQLAFYADGCVALGLVAQPEQVAAIIVAQEKTPPYLVNTRKLDAMSLRIGREENRRAISTYVECTRSNTWPGYNERADQIPLIGVPAWAERRWMMEDHAA